MLFVILFMYCQDVPSFGNAPVRSNCVILHVVLFILYIYIYIYPILFSFRLPVCNARYIYIYIYIYIICASTHNHNNEFILEFILRKTKMADFKCQQLEIQLEFVH